MTLLEEIAELVEPCRKNMAYRRHLVRISLTLIGALSVIVFLNGCQTPDKIELQLRVADRFDTPKILTRTVRIRIDIPGYDLANGNLESSPWTMSSFTMSARREGWRVVNIDVATAEMTRTFDISIDHSSDGAFTYTFMPCYQMSKKVGFPHTTSSYTALLKGSVIRDALVAEGYRVAQTIASESGAGVYQRPEVYVQFPVTWWITLPTQPSSYSSGQVVRAAYDDDTQLNFSGPTIENRFLAQEFLANVPVSFAWTNWSIFACIALLFVVLAIIGAGTVFFVRRRRRT